MCGFSRLPTFFSPDSLSSGPFHFLLCEHRFLSSCVIYLVSRLEFECSDYFSFFFLFGVCDAVVRGVGLDILASGVRSVRVNATTWVSREGEG